jgi:hypothetical protein
MYFANHILANVIACNSRDMVLTIPVLLYQQSGKQIYVGSGSIDKELLVANQL